MNAIRRFFYMSVLIVPVCCGRPDTLNVTYLGEEVKERAQHVSPEAVYELPDSILSYYAYVCGGRYAVCQMETREYSAEVYDLATGTMAGRLLHYGNGPGEVLFPRYSVNCDTIYVNDFSRKKLHSIPISSLPSGKVSKTYDVEFMSASYFPHRGSLVALNPYWFSDEETGIDNGEPLLFRSDGKEIPYDTDKVFSLNVTQGELLSSPDGERIMYARMSEPYVVFLDGDLRTVREVHGPMDCKARYVEGAGGLGFWGSSCHSYMSSCADAESVYLLYEGVERSLRDDSIDWDHSPHDLYVFRFDWDGELVSSYVLDGVTSVVTNLSSGPVPGTLYVSTLFPDRENLHILYYDLNNLDKL